MSPRKLVKSVLFHARGAQIRALAASRETPWLRRRLRLPANEVFDPLAAAGERDTKITRLDAAETFVRPLPAVVDANPDVTRFFAARAVEATAPTYAAELTNAIAWGHPTGAVFTSDGRFIPAFSHEPAGADHHTVWTRLHLPQPSRLPGRTLYLVTPEATDNYHHWLIDLLPRIGLVRRAGFAPSDFDHVIVNHAGRRYQLETLARLGIAAEKLILARESVYVRCDQLVVPSLKPSNQSLPAADLRFLRDTFLGEQYHHQGPRRRLFLSRSDAAFRRLRNEAEVHGVLRAHDFELVSLAGLEVAEQARLFAGAEYVAGPAGAAFANLVFAPLSARVIEIVPPQWLAVFHWMISARIGLEHTIVLGEGPVMRGVPDATARQRDIIVAPQKLSALLGCELRPSPAIT